MLEIFKIIWEGYTKITNKVESSEKFTWIWISPVVT